MRILAVSDQSHLALYDYFDKERWKDIDLIVSCGDLDPKYLSFLVTVINVPLVYVPGNHDQRYRTEPPQGCDSFDEKAEEVKGIRIAGLGGSLWYNGKPLQYTEKQMARRVKKIIRKAKKLGGLDLFLTHAPPRGIHDNSDRCHTGFVAFHTIIDEFHPKVFVHGHNHEVYSKEDRETVVDGVRVINAYGYYVFDMDG